MDLVVTPCGTADAVGLNDGLSNIEVDGELVVGGEPGPVAFNLPFLGEVLLLLDGVDKYGIRSNTSSSSLLM